MTYPCQQPGTHHSHLAAEGVVADGLPDAVVAVNHRPRTAEVVGNVVVPAGRSAVGIQLHIATAKPPQQRCVATQYQVIDEAERSVILHAVGIVSYYVINSAKIHYYINHSKCFHQKCGLLRVPNFLLVSPKPIYLYIQLFFFLLNQLLSCLLNLSKSLLQYVLVHPFHDGLLCIFY